MPARTGSYLGIASICALLLFLYAAVKIPTTLSPQGCRMSWMSPSYVLQSQFDSRWTPLANRYSLWLYREVGWDYVLEGGGRTNSVPVLFIPGNAGSSHQVRSIASSAARQYYSSPTVIAAEFASRNLKALDMFAVEFNEDLSAFHSSTLESQIAYTSKAIAYILSLYAQGTKIIIMAHSMGGIVAASLLPSQDISAIITMSTPFTLPPARFDSRIDTIYRKVQDILDQDQTPIVSICGGATDMMIMSEACILPKTSNLTFRRTVFSSALEGAWTGVGHREMVWCHQVRWRIARAALELGAAYHMPSRARVLDAWLRDGHTLPPSISDGADELDLSDISKVTLLPSGDKLVLTDPRGFGIHLLPVLANPTVVGSQRLTVLVSKGTIASVAPHKATSLAVTIYNCVGHVVSSARCNILMPETLKLIPNPSSGTQFPVPGEGSDESDGVVLFEADIPGSQDLSSETRWLALKIEGGEGQGWVIADIDENESTTTVATNTLGLLFKSEFYPIPPSKSLSTSFTFPNLLSNALIVYRLEPSRSHACPTGLLPPLIVHNSHPAETHYFPALSTNQHVLLHTHLDAPFIDAPVHKHSEVKFQIYASRESECLQQELDGFTLSVDWLVTLGRWSSRYFHTIVAWAAGFSALVVLLGWRQDEKTSFMPSVTESLAAASSLLIRYLLPASLVLAFLPLPPSIYVGNTGIGILAPIAPVLLIIASGLVSVMWWILRVLLWIFVKISAVAFGSRSGKESIHRGTIFSLIVTCTVIFVFVPWQVAYLGCWLLHLYSCAAAQHEETVAMKESQPASSPVRKNSNEISRVSPILPGRRASNTFIRQNNLNHNLHLLLLMTWLLPLTAPILAVWVRTLLTAGYTTPFDGDHNFLAVLPFLIYADFASWTREGLFSRPSLEKRLSIRWLFVVIALTALFFGARRPYLVLDVARITMWVTVGARIGRRYWGGTPWT